MLVISWQGRTVARVDDDDFDVEPHIEVLEADHPHRRWVTCLGLFGQRVLAGDIPAPYSDSRARLFARAVLLPDEIFCDLAELPDAWIAEHFNVPLAEVAEKREDIRALLTF
jgi:hypothetical protein